MTSFTYGSTNTNDQYRATSSGTTVAYPIYDGHGKMVATLAKNGTGYNLNNRHSFGAGGEIRQGATIGEPNGRYCANLGHLDDDESGLTYMRARYYESGSGRQAIIGSFVEGMNQGKKSSATMAVFAIGAYSMAVLAALICTPTTSEPPY